MPIPFPIFSAFYGIVIEFKSLLSFLIQLLFILDGLREEQFQCANSVIFN